MAMQYFRISAITISIILALGLLLPLQVLALSDSGVIISELQTTDDVIEISNSTEDNVDISGWVIQTKATSTTSIWLNRLTFPEGLILYPAGSILITAEGYLVEDADFHLSFNMATDKGHVRLVDNKEIPVEQDKLGWGEEAYDAETMSAPKPTLGLTLQRAINESGFIDTDNNSVDFVLRSASFTSNNIPPSQEEVVYEVGDVSEETEYSEEVVDDTSSDTETETTEDSESFETTDGDNLAPEVESTQTYPKLLINEFLPDPESPLLDANDEWIEIYNPNDVTIDLSGYVVRTGNSANYSYIFNEVELLPLGFVVISSAETNLTLSNSGGAVRIYSPSGELLDERFYSDVKEGWSYMYSNDGQWYWTTTPTFATINLYTLPTPAQKTVKDAAVKAAKVSSTKPKVATAKKTAAKTTAVKKASTEERTVFEEPAIVDGQPTLHPTILVGGALLAVIYGLYEYRSDLRNIGHRLRSNRKTGAKNSS